MQIRHRLASRAGIALFLALCCTLLAGFAAFLVNTVTRLILIDSGALSRDRARTRPGADSA